MQELGDLRVCKYDISALFIVCPARERWSWPSLGRIINMVVERRELYRELYRTPTTAELTVTNTVGNMCNVYVCLPLELEHTFTPNAGLDLGTKSFKATEMLFGPRRSNRSHLGLYRGVCVVCNDARLSSTYCLLLAYFLNTNDSKDQLASVSRSNLLNIAKF